MKRKGQSMITLLYVLLVFNLIWIFLAAPMINSRVSIAIAQGTLVGINAYALSHLNLVIFFFQFIVLASFTYLGGSR